MRHTQNHMEKTKKKNEKNSIFVEVLNIPPMMIPSVIMLVTSSNTTSTIPNDTFSCHNTNKRIYNGLNI